MGDWKIHDVTESMTLDGVTALLGDALKEHGDLPLIALFDDGAASEYGRIKHSASPTSSSVMIYTDWIDPNEEDFTGHLKCSNMIKNLQRLRRYVGADLVTEASLEGGSVPMGGDIRMVMHEENFGGVLVLGVEDPEYGNL